MMIVDLGTDVSKLRNAAGFTAGARLKRLFEVE